MPLLSFSLPHMLPALVAGLEQAWRADPEQVELDPEDSWEWLAARFAEPLAAWRARPAAARSAAVKRQTIRRDSGSARSPWARLQPGDLLHLWWRSRTPGRRLLGCAPCRDVRRVEILHDPAAGLRVALEDAPGSGRQEALDDPDLLLRRVAGPDGHGDLASFAGFFVPQPGDRFVGRAIRW